MLITLRGLKCQTKLDFCFWTDRVFLEILIFCLNEVCVSQQLLGEDNLNFSVTVTALMKEWELILDQTQQPKIGLALILEDT